MNLFKVFTVFFAFGFLGLVGCSSGQTKRKEQQTQVVKNSKIYCEFVNGENNQDIDVVLNIQMGARCDFERPYSISNYKTPADITGMMFCCGVANDKNEKKTVSAKAEPVAEAAKDAVAAPATPAVAPAVAPVEVKQEATQKQEVKQEVKAEERKPNSVKPKPGAQAPKKNPYSDLDL